MVGRRLGSHGWLLFVSYTAVTLNHFLEDLNRLLEDLNHFLEEAVSSPP